MFFCVVESMEMQHPDAPPPDASNLYANACRALQLQLLIQQTMDTLKGPRQELAELQAGMLGVMKTLDKRSLKGTHVNMRKQCRTAKSALGIQKIRDTFQQFTNSSDERVDEFMALLDTTRTRRSTEKLLITAPPAYDKTDADADADEGAGGDDGTGEGAES